MDVVDIRIKIRSVVLSITSFIIILLILRIFLDLFSASQDNFIVRFIAEVSDLFIHPFREIISEQAVMEMGNINIVAILALVMYLFVGILISEFISGFFYEKFETIVQNVVNVAFKILEFVIFLRILIDFFEISRINNLVNSVVDLTEWTQDVFISATLLDGRINISTVLILILIIFLDLITEGLLVSLFERIIKKEETPRLPGDKNSKQNINIHVTPPPNVHTHNTYVHQRLQNPSYRPENNTVQKESILDRIRRLFGRRNR